MISVRIQNNTSSYNKDVPDSLENLFCLHYNYRRSFNLNNRLALLTKILNWGEARTDQKDNFFTKLSDSLADEFLQRMFRSNKNKEDFKGLADSQFRPFENVVGGYHLIIGEYQSWISELLLENYTNNTKINTSKILAIVKAANPHLRHQIVPI